MRGGGNSLTAIRKGFGPNQEDKIHNKYPISASFNFSANSFKKVLSGFTLSEVLITLGIIGVVAAMTLPALIQKQQDKVTVTKVKKAYSIFSQAYAMAIEANGGLPKEEWDCSAFDVTSDGSQRSRCYTSYLLPYIKNVESCYVDGGKHSNCTFSSFMQGATEEALNLYYNINGESRGELRNGGGGYSIAADGIEFMMHQGHLFIKTDRKPKNVLNQNIFLFRLGENRLTYSICGQATEIEHYLRGYTAPGCTCSAVDWILLYENLDYMRCPDKVAINGKHSCR